METQLERAFVCRTKALAHFSRPYTTRSSILRNLLEEIVVSVEKERNSGNEFVYIQPGFQAPVDVFQAIAQGEGEFLYRSRSRFTNVITTHRDGIVARHMLRAELKGVHHQLHRRLDGIYPFLLSDVLPV